MTMNIKKLYMMIRKANWMLVRHVVGSLCTFAGNL